MTSCSGDRPRTGPTRTPQEFIYEYAMASFLARIGYSFDDRYFLVGSIRRDASSKLPAAKNYDWFPSVSGSWKISSEKFFQNLGPGQDLQPGQAACRLGTCR